MLRRSARNRGPDCKRNNRCRHRWARARTLRRRLSAVGRSLISPCGFAPIIRLFVARSLTRRRVGLTTEDGETQLCPAMALLRRDAETVLPVNFGQAFGETLALGIH